MLRIDVGCGTTKHKNCKIGLDKHNFGSFYAPGEFIQCDVLDGLPFAGDSLYGVYCHHLLEHIPHRHPTEGIDALVFIINEFNRVLKRGYDAYIVVPYMEHTNAWRHPTHYRFFNHEVFAWFDFRVPNPDHITEGLIGEWWVTVNRVQDEAHILAIMRKVS